MMFRVTVVALLYPLLRETVLGWTCLVEVPAGVGARPDLRRGELAAVRWAAGLPLLKASERGKDSETRGGFVVDGGDGCPFFVTCADTAVFLAGELERYSQAPRRGGIPGRARPAGRGNPAGTDGDQQQLTHPATGCVCGANGVVRGYCGFTVPTRPQWRVGTAPR